MKNTFIYTLNHPDTFEIRYIGKANIPSKRLYKHILDVNKTKSHKNNWIKSLLKENKKPIIEVLDEVPMDDWEYWEKYWIAQFKQWNYNLTNISEGGRGPNGVKRDDKTKSKMGKSRKGIPLSAEHKQKISTQGKIYHEENPSYNMKGKNERIPMDRDLLYQKYITENMSMPEMSKYFDVSEKKIFDELHHYDIKKENGWWLDKIADQYKKVVLQYDLRGKLLKEWEGITDISKEMGYNGSNIANCCRDIIKSSHGFIWRYKDEWLELPNFDKSVSKNINRSIKKLDLNKNIIKKYSSITLAAKDNGLKSTNIRLCCEGKAKTHKGFIWQFD